MAESNGAQSTDVTGARWKVKFATNCGLDSLKLRRSQMRSDPSSAPVATMQLASLFHDMTLTSASCVLTRSAGLARMRASHTHTVWSAEHDMKTSRSPGDHWMSSTLDVCPVKGVAPTSHFPCTGSHV